MHDEIKRRTIDEAVEMDKDVDVVIIGCRPKEPLPWEIRLGNVAGINLAEHYTGSEEFSCDSCGRAVMMGPRQVELKNRTEGPTLILCLVCVVKLQSAAQSATGLTAEIYNLGNPEFDDDSGDS